MSEQKTEKEKVTTIQLEIRQFEHLLVAFGSIARELQNITKRQEKFEGAVIEALTKIESELKLLRIEIMDKKGKFEDKVKK